MKNLPSLLFATLLIGLFSHQAQAGPVVLELYTSQNCSSCPTADRLLERLAARPDTIALACHITYFDSGRWRDTMGREFCNRRQGEYAKAFGRGNRVYTPQMIVNGAAQMNGADEKKVRDALIAAPPVATIALQKDVGGSVRLQLPAMPGIQARIKILGYHRSVRQPIAAGENAGRTLSYANAVTGLDDIMPWQGEALIFSFSPSVAADAYAVLAEDVRTGRILAAGKIEN